MNHQEIKDRLEAIKDESFAAGQRAREAFDKLHANEVKRLRAECAQLGHVFARSFTLLSHRCCAVCGVGEPGDPTADNLTRVA